MYAFLLVAVAITTTTTATPLASEVRVKLLADV
jgi:hypothetical protein